MFCYFDFKDKNANEQGKQEQADGSSTWYGDEVYFFLHLELLKSAKLPFCRSRINPQCNEIYNFPFKLYVKRIFHRDKLLK